MACITRLTRPVAAFPQRIASVNLSACFSTVPAAGNPSEDKLVKTHTGQSFANDDYRIMKFNGKAQEVNTRFAIDLIAEVAPIPVKGRTTFCDGGDGPLGHPRVFINLDQPGNHSCGYCGLRFFQDGSHSSH